MNIVNEIKFKKYSKSVFDNGLTVISEQVPGMCSYSAGICIKTGSRDDYENQAGIAHFMEHAAFRHTKNRTSKQIANQFEALGAFSNAFTTKDATCFYVRAINEHFEKTFELLADITLNTVFVEDEIEKEKLVIIEEIKSYEDDPEEYIFDLADNLVFSNHNLGLPIVGTQESVSNIYCSDLQKFHDQFYNPQNIIICSAGNIAHEDIITSTVKYLDNIMNKNSSNYVQSVFSEKPEAKMKQIKRQIQQSHLVLGKRTKGFRSEERYPLAVLNTLLGDGMSSRLYQNLREKHGLAYSIYSSLYNYYDCGSWYIYAATGEKEYDRAVELIYNELNKLRDKLPSKKELQRAKEQLKTATIIELESMSSRMQDLLKNEINEGNFQDILDVIGKIEAVELDDLSNISKEYFTNDNWSIASILPE